ncbi:MAG TPA: hypothetical protein VGF29_13195 [Hyphomicrobiaceae bacterium]|jgi:hypothetical protein
MDREQELAVVHRAYAKQIMAVMGTGDARVETAFAEVRREQSSATDLGTSCSGRRHTGRRRMPIPSICIATISWLSTPRGM